MNVKDETDVRKLVQQHLDWAANKVSHIANAISNASTMNSQEKSLDEIYKKSRKKTYSFIPSLCMY